MTNIYILIFFFHFKNNDDKYEQNLVAKVFRQTLNTHLNFFQRSIFRIESINRDSYVSKLIMMYRIFLTKAMRTWVGMQLHFILPFGGVYI